MLPSPRSTVPASASVWSLRPLAQLNGSILLHKLSSWPAPDVLTKQLPRECKLPNGGVATPRRSRLLLLRPPAGSPSPPTSLLPLQGCARYVNAYVCAPPPAPPCMRASECVYSPRRLTVVPTGFVCCFLNYVHNLAFGWAPRGLVMFASSCCCKNKKEKK